METKQKIQYVDNEELTNDEDSDNQSRELIEIENRLRSKKKLSRQKSSQSPNKTLDILEADGNSAVLTKKIMKSSSFRQDSDSEFEDSIQDDVKSSELKSSDATFNSWHDLKHSEEKVELPRSFFADGPTPWANFHDLVLGRRFLNARLSPTTHRDSRANFKQVTWSESQVKIVKDLIKEANSLMDMFDQVAMLLGPDVKLHNVSGLN